MKSLAVYYKVRTGSDVPVPVTPSLLDRYYFDGQFRTDVTL